MAPRPQPYDLQNSPRLRRMQHLEQTMKPWFSLQAKKPTKNDHQKRRIMSQDDFTYLNAACARGDTVTALELLREGADVDQAGCTRSPLHYAAHLGQAAVVRILLEHGADPNRPDHEDGSTALHALANADDYGREEERATALRTIVELLVAAGASVEARNFAGQSPLGLAVSRFEFGLARLLLERAGAASLDGLQSENLALDADDERPRTFCVAKMMDLLVAHGFYMDFENRLRFLKCWLRARARDNEFSEPKVCEILGHGRTDFILNDLDTRLAIRKKFDFYMGQGTEDRLLEKRERLLDTYVPGNKTRGKLRTYYRWRFNEVEAEADAAKLKAIMLTESLSLYRACQLSPAAAASILRSSSRRNNWLRRVFPGPHLEHLGLFVQRHVAEIFARIQFEFFAADLFMTEGCRLNLPHAVCSLVAERMSDEELYRLCEQTSETNWVD
ncbi:uncharacterized protein LOC106653462 [Trichogramma pretiosum]|uniref:uncharacterized protein LOC106653462 n=1 Tax=Trichogramma pretiosum TaxID=7493 RepID=UPI0006C9A7CE|nr:uncharacterized protein LOC106653462 [Trichogramma pretiosum]